MIDPSKLSASNNRWLFVKLVHNIQNLILLMQRELYTSSDYNHHELMGAVAITQAAQSLHPDVTSTFLLVHTSTPR